MAKETKVGLLAGLAFIICFAVILTNRGQTQRYAADTGLDSTLRLNRMPSRGPTVAAATEDRFRDILPEFNRIDSPRQRERALGNPAQARPRASVPTVSGSEIDWTLERADGSGSDGVINRDTVGRVDYAPSRRQTEPGRITRREGFEDARVALAELLKHRTGYGAALSSEPQVPMADTDRSEPTTASSMGSVPKQCTTDAKRGRASARPLLTHRVVAGETLSSIARRYYGAGTRRNIDAILDMNRALLANPDRIKVGMSLVLPDLPLEATRAALRQPAVKRNARLVASRHRATAAVRWYQVRKNDRYVSIARKQLGDASRWREIYDLNKDKFPDPNQIRDGVRIKLPPR